MRNSNGTFASGRITPIEIRNRISSTLDQTGDIIGKTFGTWLVLRKDHIRSGQRLWWCRCGCGIEKHVIGRHLVTGKSTNCIKCSGKKNSERALNRGQLKNGRINFLPGNSGLTTQSSWVGRVKKELIEKQKGICPICVKPLPSDSKGQCFDHDHATLKSRAIVHRGCNVLIGFVERDPEIVNRVKNYLESYQ